MTPKEAIELLADDDLRPEALVDCTPYDLQIARSTIEDAQRIQRSRLGPFGMLANECDRRAALLEQDGSLRDLAIEVRDLAKWCRERAAEDAAWREEP